MTVNTSPPSVPISQCVNDVCAKSTSTLQQHIASLEAQVNKDAITKLNLRSQMKDVKQKKESYKAYCMPLKDKAGKYDKLMEASTKLGVSPDALPVMLIECRERLVDAEFESNRLQDEIMELSTRNIESEEKLRSMEAFIGEYCATTSETCDLVEDVVRHRFNKNMDKQAEIARRHGVKISNGKVSMLADYHGKRKVRFHTEEDADDRELKKVMLIKVKDQKKCKEPGEPNLAHRGRPGGD